MPDRRLELRDLTRTLVGVLPEVQNPSGEIPIRQKAAYTVASLVIFLVGSNLPLYGVRHSSAPDPLYWMHTASAYNSDSIMADGICSLVLSEALLHFLLRVKIINVGTALVDMYGKHGRLGCCSSAFEVVCKKEVSTWNALLSALANHGKETEALVKFDVMRGEGFLPNQITFLALLTACARAGLVEVGLYWFEAMVAEYKVAPLMVHYGCVVDLLGRAGRFGEAIEVIERMPFAADASVWGALLGACKLHGNVELAVEIGQKLMSLGPQQSGRYMTIRNVYLEDGNWHAGARMGEVMQESGIMKAVGQSSVVPVFLLQ